MFPKALVSTCCVLALCAIASGQVTLEHKFNEGSSYAVDSTMKIEQKLTIAGMEVNTDGDTRTTSRTTVGKRESDGKLRVQEKVEVMTISAGVNGVNYHFDSANPENKGDSPLEMLRDVHKEMVQRTQTTTYDKFDKAVAVDFDQPIGNSLSDEVKKIIKSQLDPETLKTAANDGLDQLKSEPLSKGETWQRTRNMNFGSGQNMSFQTEYTYAGPVEKEGKTLEKVTTKTIGVSYVVENSPLPFTVKNSELKPTDSEGVILFDRAKGRIVESNATVHITGDMTFTINGNDLPVKLDLKMQTATAENP